MNNVKIENINLNIEINKKNLDIKGDSNGIDLICKNVRTHLQIIYKFINLLGFRNSFYLWSKLPIKFKVKKIN